MQLRTSEIWVLSGLAAIALSIFCCCGVMVTPRVVGSPVVGITPISTPPPPITIDVVSWQDHQQTVEGHNLISVNVVLTNSSNSPVLTFGNVYFIRTDDGSMIGTNIFASEMAGQTGRIGGNVLPGQQQLTLGFFVPPDSRPLSFVYDDPRYTPVEMELQ